MTITKDNESVPQSVGLDEALQQMKEDGVVPDGFHMMFFSEEFSLAETCPMNQVLRMITMNFGCSDTLRRQVFQMPNNRNVITYEFAWLGPFEEIKQVMENIDRTITDAINRLMKNNELKTAPKRRVQFLLAQQPSVEDLPVDEEDSDLF
jgi:hypothetical protein